MASGIKPIQHAGQLNIAATFHIKQMELDGTGGYSLTGETDIPVRVQIQRNESGVMGTDGRVVSNVELYIVLRTEAAMTVADAKEVTLEINGVSRRFNLASAFNVIDSWPSTKSSTSYAMIEESAPDSSP